MKISAIAAKPFLMPISLLFFCKWNSFEKECLRGMIEALKFYFHADRLVNELKSCKLE